MQRSRISQAFRSVRWMSSERLPQGVPERAKIRLPRGVVAVHGRDSAKFLNGLLTVRPPDSANTIASYAGMLNAKGRVVADMFVYQAHDTAEVRNQLGASFDGSFCYLLDVDTTMMERVMRILDFHILTSDVNITPLAGLGVWSTWDDTVETGANPDTDGGARLFNIDDPRVPGLGQRFIAPNSAEITPTSHLNNFNLRRYLLGVPEGATELVPNKALPLDFCMDYMGGIDFDKGCYIGQELTIRTHHHGSVRKRIAPVVFTPVGSDPPENLYSSEHDYEIAPNTDITDSSPVPNEQSVASIFASSQNPFGSTAASSSARQRPAGSVVAALGNVGLAMIRLDKLGHDFRVQDGQVSVHAFTPFWWPADPAPAN